MNEVEEKIARLARLADAHNVSGVLLTRQANFAWLSAGESNRIDSSSEIGSGSLLVTREGRHFIVANTIEMPRLRDEALAGLGFTPLEYPWVDDHGEPAAAATIAREVAGGEPIGVDAAVPGALDLQDAIAATRVPLTDDELQRYRRLGHDIAAVIAAECRALRPGLSETEVAGRVVDAAWRVGARAVVTLVGADDRIASFRHPVPGPTTWKQTLLVGLCAERHGLVVALSRMIASAPVPDTLTARTEAAAQVFARLLDATRPGVTGAALFATAAEAYVHVGFPGEEARHHQGGAIGYRSRDWIAHPGSCEVVSNRQAFAWNPSITGTKVEDTALITGDGPELITLSTAWPTHHIVISGRHVQAPGVLTIEA